MKSVSEQPRVLSATTLKGDKVRNSAGEDLGKIMPGRITGNCAGHQRRLTVAIKQARTVALLPYTSVYP